MALLREDNKMIRVQFDCYSSKIHTEVRQIKINGNDLVYLDVFTEDSSLTLFLRPEQLELLKNVKVKRIEDCDLDC